MKIQLKNISFRYKSLGASSNGKLALQQINLMIQGHEMIGIVGASGSGKTTLVQMLNGLLQPDNGDVLIDNQNAAYKGEGVWQWRQRVGIVFQFPELQFFENTVYDEIAYALRNQKMAEAEIHTRVENVLNTLELAHEDWLHRSPFHLSEGQKRRIAIASILVVDPEILILDEPTAGLDFAGVETLKRIIKKIYQEDRSIIIVSHDMNFVAELANRIVNVSNGRIVYDGSKKDFYLNEELLSESHLQLPDVMQAAKKLWENGKLKKYPVFSLNELRKYFRD